MLPRLHTCFTARALPPQDAYYAEKDQGFGDVGV
jgi:hypothetical protein